MLNYFKRLFRIPVTIELVILGIDGFSDIDGFEVKRSKERKIYSMSYSINQTSIFFEYVKGDELEFTIYGDGEFCLTFMDSNNNLIYGISEYIFGTHVIKFK